MPSIPNPARLCVHHVGARGYDVAFVAPEAYREDLVHVLYEADPECAERMRERPDSGQAHRLAEKHLYPFCLARARGRATLNITANAYASSLYPPDPAFFRNYCEIAIEHAAYDVTYADMLEVVRRVEVETHSLDGLLAEGIVPATLRPDVLTIDTQGYELEILEGARQAVDDGVLAVICEVEMQPMYAGQPLFGDVLSYMARRGFLYAGLTGQVFGVSPHRAQVGLRARAFPGFGDALFLRDLDSLDVARLGDERLYLMLGKAAFVALCYGFLEYALLAMARAQALRPRVSKEAAANLEATRFGRYLDELREAVAQHQAPYLPVHAIPKEARSPDDARVGWFDRHHATAVERVRKTLGITWRGIVQGLLPPLPVRVLARNLPAPLVRAIRQFFVFGRDIPEWSGVERVLRGGGFGEVASLARDRRIMAQRYLRHFDEAMRRDAGSAHLGPQ